MLLTPNCTDPEYNTPILDTSTDKTSPVPHRLVTGHLNGTDVDFKIYLTPKPQWDGRFFQVMYPTQNSTALDNAIVFGVESGGYTVQASGTTGYRADAAVAQYSRQVARDYYNTTDHIYGYIYGGSGGSLKTTGASEKTRGIWDGCNTLIQGTPVSIPYGWNIRHLGGFVMQNAREAVNQTLQPGGNGDPASALAEPWQKAVFDEVSSLGAQVRIWENWSGVMGNRTQGLQTLKDIAIPMVQGADPSYADDFWTKDGYAGSEDSGLGEAFRSALFAFNSTVQDITTDSTGLTSDFTLDHVPEGTGNVVGLGFSVVVNCTRQPFSGMLHPDTRTVYILDGASESTRKALTRDAVVQVDNRWWLAMHTYHRHQVPDDEEYYVYDALRDSNGRPLYPQRDVLLGPTITKASTGGSVYSGNITMKTMVMDTLLDYDAYPWQADWYKARVRAAKGNLDDYRLYYAANAEHNMGPVGVPYDTRVVDFTGIYQQHLRDLAAWVERGVEPPAATEYRVGDGGQVTVPRGASERRGVQPVVEVSVNGGKMVRASVGESVMFRMVGEVPNGVGEIVKLELDPLGVGDFADMNATVGGSVEGELEYAYREPGVYLASARVASERNGNTETEVALALNVDRVKVVVG